MKREEKAKGERYTVYKVVDFLIKIRISIYG